MINKQHYLDARQNGLLERFRGDEISRELAKRYPLSAQIALLMDKEDKPEEWNLYQAFRAEVKAKVDAEIAAIEAEFEEVEDEA